jgi:hypothetical protein
MPNPNRLIVESKADLYAVVELMKAHIDWGEPPPVKIVTKESINAILEHGYLSSELKDPQVRRLGVIVDADAHAHGRYERIAQLVGNETRLPKRVPEKGLVAEVGDKRFGVWIMPDNRSGGMLETFLGQLVPTKQQEVWDYALDAAKQAAGMGAPYSAAHLDRARIHTWLAWQDPPGMAFGLAILKRALDGGSPIAAPFTSWFRRLFEL